MSCLKDYFSEEELQELSSNVFTYLKAKTNIFSFIQALWESNFKVFDLELSARAAFEAIKINSTLSTSGYAELFINSLKTSEYKKHRRKSFVSSSKMDFQYQFLENYLENVSTFLDFGSGKLATLRKISSNNLSIKMLYGFDPNSNPRFTSSDPRIRFLTSLDEVKKLRNLDLVYSSLVLHHLTFDQLEESLKTISDSLQKGGKFILLEEAFPETLDEILLESSQEKLKNFGYEMNSELVSEFENFSEVEKYLIIYFNDYLINLGNLNYMPWTFEYRTLDCWIELVEKFGIKAVEKYYFGIVKNKGMKQGITSVMVFEK